ncbi:SRPBCC family protein [Ensifer sp. Root278]|uniref:SRPBCC family protein n=1 Tax=Ensifer sp. Root278 TaxID=1736509 RepID=UPI0007088DB5|nr:SRPBCC family protein [Ensifer sp. Root278]KRD60882.1 polyketide cyclase [Ensifer sp. Root278]
MSYIRSAESVTGVAASPETLFDFLDDQAALGSHMGKPSMMMLGGRMSYSLDDSAGRAVGSRISMRGSVLGLELTVDEVIVEHRPPVSKVWETLGRPDLLVIGAYRMGFEIHGSGGGSRLRVFINYDDPATVAGRIIGPLLGRIYARWCVTRMARDATSRFRQ